MSKRKTLKPIHPGETLKLDLMDEYGLTASRLAADIGVPAGRISQIINGQRAITADTALRLARYFETTPQFWMNLQAQYDIECAIQDKETEIRAAVKPLKAQASSA